MDAKVTWKGHLAFEAVADSGKSIVMDSGPTRSSARPRTDGIDGHEHGWLHRAWTSSPFWGRRNRM